MIKKILFAIPTLDRRGPDRVFFELINNLSRTKYECSLAIQEDTGYYLKYLSKDVKCYIIGNSSQKNSKYPIAALRSIILQEKPDLVISTLRMIVTATFALIGIPNFPIHIIRPANHLTLDTLFLIRQSPIKHSISFLVNILTLWLSNFIVCQSNQLQQDLGRYAPLKNKSTVINNPIDIAQVTRNALKENIKLKGSPAILAIGRLYPQKGFDILIEAIANVFLDYPNLFLTILGEGPERAKLESLIIDKNLENNVKLLGFCSNPYPYIRACDFMVSSSRYEGFPNVVLESIALGKPVLATNCPGGTSEIVVPNLTGWLTPTADVGLMSENLIKAINNYKNIKSSEVIDFCDENFSIQKIISEYESLVDQSLVKVS